MANSMAKESTYGRTDLVTKDNLYKAQDMDKGAGNQRNPMETSTSEPTKTTRRMAMAAMSGQMGACTREDLLTM